MFSLYLLPQLGRFYHLAGVGTAPLLLPVLFDILIKLPSHFIYPAIIVPNIHSILQGVAKNGRLVVVDYIQPY